MSDTLIQLVGLAKVRPAPIMKDDVAARTHCEPALRSSAVPAMMIRPRFTTGPGRWRSRRLKPGHWICGHRGATRESAHRRSLVSLGQMRATLVRPVNDPPETPRIREMPDIRRAAELPS
ncbi:MAG TPA: hypothetical protein VFS39_08060 [Nitrospira sp.]|nr:hypothetical protein [Nitrospira sp.]